MNVISVLTTIIFVALIFKSVPTLLEVLKRFYHSLKRVQIMLSCPHISIRNLINALTKQPMC
jgi:hypothetical protein